MVSIERTALDQALSAVMDGRATAQQWEQVEAAWAHDPSLRERWIAWQAAADGLRSVELLVERAGAQALLDRLHASLPVPAQPIRRRREWLAPFAVAAGFIAMAVGILQLRPAVPTDTDLAAARISTVPMQGLAGASFAQTAAGRTLVPDVGARDAAWPAESSPQWLDWPPSAADDAASSPRLP